MCSKRMITTDSRRWEATGGDIERRKAKIAKSVEMVGYIHAPIIVNEKMEIIDGQARFAYCKEHEIPITYYVIHGLTIDECIAMNIGLTNWNIRDYIKSYADRGFQSYVLAEKFLEMSPYSYSPTMWALIRTEATNSGTVNKIKEGRLTIDQESFSAGRDIIAFWEKFDDIKSNRRNDFLIALGYCYMLTEVDNNILVKKIHDRPRDFMTIANITDAIGVIEDTYNVRRRDHVYIETEYFKYLEGKKKGITNAILTSLNRRERS